MSDILRPETLSRIDAFYDATLTPKLNAIDYRRRQVRWLIVKSLLVVLPPIGFLIAGDLLDSILPFNSSAGTVVVAGLWLVAGLVFVLLKYLLPGVTAYANYRSRFKQDIVAEIFKVVCPSAVYDPLQGITPEVFDAPGLFNTRGSFQCDDRVRGRIGRTPFEASEVGRAYTTGTGKHARSHEVFRGLFFHLDFNQRLSGVTLIDPERAQSHQIGERTRRRPGEIRQPGVRKRVQGPRLERVGSARAVDPGHDGALLDADPAGGQARVPRLQRPASLCGRALRTHALRTGHCLDHLEGCRA